MSVMDTARKVVEATYAGVCDIYEVTKKKDKVTKVTSNIFAKVNESPIPCGLSFDGKSTTVPSEGAAKKVQKIELFLSPDIKILAGSRIVVTQNGVTQSYKNSGVAAVYETHQEVLLEISEEWA